MNEIKCPKCNEIFSVSEDTYKSITSQIRNSLFEEELQKQVDLINAEKENSLKLKEAQLSQKVDKLYAQLEKEKLEYNNKIQQIENESSNKINKLKNEIAINDTNTKLKIREKENELNIQLANKEIQIKELNNELTATKAKSELELSNEKERHNLILKSRDDEIQYYKDYKSKLSTKMIGESLELYCETEFNKLRATAFNNAYFEKDNDIKTGSKGDYIFRDFSDDNTEYISIMFEMKNEADKTDNKKKNEDFFKKLDKDRNDKGCEYAVLVSLLENESELYNAGIVDVSHRFPKMYVIRPQFFIPIISLLKNTSLKSLDYKKELMLIKNQSIDVSNFEAEMNDFKDKFGRNYRLASDKFNDAIKGIDKTIAELEKTKKNLLSSENNLRLANEKAQDLSIKKLVKDNKTMKEKFDNL